MSLTPMFQRGLSVTRRIHRNPLYDWLMAASVILDASTSATQAEVRYVSKGGNDATGNGSFAKPYLTIAAAVASIADAAAAKPYEVLCAPGVYTDPFTLKPYVFVVGSGKGTAEYASSPLTGLTIITPAANVLSAAFTGAVDGPTGIISCSVAAVLNVDWNAIGSTGQATFLLQNTLHQKTVNFIGLAAGNTAHYPTISNVTTNDLVNINLTNCGGSDIVGELSDFGGPITFTQSAPIQSFHNVSGSFAGIITATWTSALLANNMTIACGGPQTAANPTLTGDGIIFSSPGLFSRKVIADAATSTLAFGTVAATTLVGVIEGSNLLEMTPTANRTLVVRAPPAVGAGAMPTTVIVRNNAAVNSGFNVDFTFGGATLAVGSPTYCPPGKEVSLRWNPGPAQFEVGPYTQSFTGIALGAGTGVSALVPADVLSAHASFVVTRKTVGGTFLTSAADGMVLPADRTVGTRAGGGGFKVSSVFQVGGLLDTGDTSTFDVHLSQ